MELHNLEEGPKSLRLDITGRILDHLGIQMYQSPVAAVAELVSNSWDADAETVRIELPDSIDANAQIVVTDDGSGMTFAECQERYLKVGTDTRKGDPSAKTKGKNRPILGRKGIGKFAGFGVARVIRVETISERTGEKTVFVLDYEALRGQGDAYGDPMEIQVLEWLPPDEDRKKQKGTTVRLMRLELGKKPNPNQFLASMARRFLLTRRVADFDVLVNGTSIREVSTEDVENIEFRFPEDYRAEEKPENLEIEDGWGVETLANGGLIKWRVVFYRTPIKEDDLRGIAVFANGKLAQIPFFFNIRGGVEAQTGMEYMSGRVEADFIDQQKADLIATERQRVNWDHPSTAPLRAWGELKIKELLRIWSSRRKEERERAITEKMSPVGERLNKLPQTERQTVENAIRAFARVDSLDPPKFLEIAHGILTVWEGGRLRTLVNNLSQAEELAPNALANLFAEASVLTTLNVGEAVLTKLTIVKKLSKMIGQKEKELKVRDLVADYPWLISPAWETFRRERSVEKLLKDTIGPQAQVDDDPDWQGRVDLALAGGHQLVIIEFMRPGTRVDWDHVDRFYRYISTMNLYLTANTGSQFKQAIGYLIADELSKSSLVVNRLGKMEREGMYAMDWEEFLRKAKSQWREFMDILNERAGNDERVSELATRAEAELAE